MISLGIVSDTHSNIKNLNCAVEYLIKMKQIDILIHLGDFSSDVDMIDKKLLENIKVYKIPGTENKNYRNALVPNKKIIQLENLRTLLTHVPRHHQYEPENSVDIQELITTQKIDLMFYGHTHQYSIMYNKILYINPGHLKDHDIQGAPPTFAYVEIDGSKIYTKILNLLFLTFFERKYII